jgi:hypothetical protein
MNFGLCFIVNEITNPLLFEMIRSFSKLAKTLNLSHAVHELSSTRQTVRRHIASLEEIKGEKLFEVVNRQYSLTEAGRNALPEADQILARGHAWLRGQLSGVDGMMRISYKNVEGWEYFQQQLKISDVWGADSALLRTAVSCWAKSGGDLESEHMKAVRPYFLVYRDTPSGWICVEVGEKSFYSKWWGWAEARSSIGRSLGEFPGGEEFATIMDTPFREVQKNHSLRLDQVAARVPREPGGDPKAICFQRLLMGVRMPDGSFALVTVVDRAEKMAVSGVDQRWIDDMPADATVDF